MQCFKLDMELQQHCLECQIMDLLDATETVDNARRISNAISVPLIVDSDTGYGNALSVWKLVKELESAGAAGIFLEDQKWPKRCGHMQGKEVISKRRIY